MAVALLLFVQEGLIKGVVNLAGRFELTFVNDFGMGFNSGVLVYALVLVAFLTAAIWFTHRKGWWAVNTLVLGMNNGVDWILNVCCNCHSKCGKPLRWMRTILKTSFHCFRI